ncbi:2-amino-4-hydroxy-6-hydroxymethyldihydropteridine diphosphokinase [bacterium]|nr:2-amino-4-hydroxy-6-hydroxymethyldihydropteridine diphosphokinase [bacterium]MBU1884669.1 2-amino-4-hydroxy-6-hydroxymethyldihydropteridine diphosphokinase [bacterium]
MVKKRVLSDKLTLIYTTRFPSVKKRSSFHRYEVTIGIGGNMGDVLRRFNHLFFKLQKDKRVEVLQTAPILKNPPFGYLDQDDFLNSVIVLTTSMQPKRFLEFLMRLEKRFSRKRSFSNAPRTLDLDILFFDNRVIDTKSLKVPHPEWMKRESVIIPLSSMSR